MPFIERDGDGNITGRYARPQHEGQEFLPPEAPEIQALEKDESWDEFRAERDRRLAQTDYALLADRPAGLTEAETTKLFDYRKALRNLPAKTTDPAAPAWPTLSATIQGKLKIALPA